MPAPNITAATKLTGLFGHPVAHSRSPEIHQQWLTHHKIDARYLAFDVAPEHLESAIFGLRSMGVLGVNLTVPHKQAVLAFVDKADNAAKAIGAANTLFWKDGTLCATNTDAYGFIENLRAQCQNLEDHMQHVLVLGAGGAARAVLQGLRSARAGKITIANRTRETAETIAGIFEAEVVDWNDVSVAMESATMLVNTTSLGMEGQPTLQISLDTLPKSALVHDIVYAPLHTPLLQAANARGNPIATGLGMLYYQAQAAFSLWHGVRPEVKF